MRNHPTFDDWRMLRERRWADDRSACADDWEPMLDDPRHPRRERNRMHDDWQVGQSTFGSLSYHGPGSGIPHQPGPQSHRGRGPKGHVRSDARLYEAVCERLEDAPEIDASDIEVTVERGEVTLRGTVENRRMKRAAEDLVESLPGVRECQNHLRTRPS